MRARSILWLASTTSISLFFACGSPQVQPAPTPVSSTPVSSTSVVASTASSTSASSIAAWSPGAPLPTLAPPTPPPLGDPCDRAIGLLAKVPTLRAEGRLDRALRSIDRAAKLCPAHAHDRDADKLALLAELGRASETRAFASTLEPTASVIDKGARKWALDEAAKSSKAFPATDAAKRPMRAKFAEAAAALDKKDFARAEKLYVAAWDAWRPNGQALFGAGLAARGLGRAADAQRYFDRAIVDLERATGAKVAFAAPNGFETSVRAPRWAPGGRMFAVLDGEHVAIYDVFTWREKLRVPARAELASAYAWSADARSIAVGGSDGVVRVWDLATGTSTAELRGHMGFVSGLAFASPTSLVSSSEDGTLRLWDLEKKSSKKLLGHTKAVHAIAVSSDGRYAASASVDRTVRIWDLATALSTVTLTGHESDVETIAFSADGRHLATGSYDRSIKVWAFDRGKGTATLERTLTGHTAWVRDVAFSPDGKSLWSACDDKTLRTWDLATGEVTSTLVDHTAAVTGVAFDPSGAIVASTARDGTVRLREAGSGRVKRTLEAHAATLDALAFASDGRTLATASSDDRARVWSTAGTAAPLRTLTGLGATARAIAIGRDDTILIGLRDGVTWTFPIGSATGVSSSPLEIGSIDAIAPSPDARAYATGSTDGALRVWSATSHAPFAALLGHRGPIVRVAWSPDGLRLASASTDGRVRLWDVGKQRSDFELTGHSDVVRDVAWSPDGTVLASASHDATVRLWDARAGLPIRAIPQTAAATSVVFSADGGRIFVGLSDRTIAVWSTHDGKKLQTIGPLDDAIVGLALRADGHALAAIARDATLRVFRADDGALVVSMRAMRDRDAGYAYTPAGDVEVVGDVAFDGQDPLLCRVGPLTFPFELCAERFARAGLVDAALVNAAPLDLDP